MRTREEKMAAYERGREMFLGGGRSRASIADEIGINPSEFGKMLKRDGIKKPGESVTIHRAVTPHSPRPQIQRRPAEDGLVIITTASNLRNVWGQLR